MASRENKRKVKGFKCTLALVSVWCHGRWSGREVAVGRERRKESVPWMMDWERSGSGRGDRGGERWGEREMEATMVRKGGRMSVSYMSASTKKNHQN